MIFALGIDNVGKKTANDLAREFEDLPALIETDKERLLNVQDVGEVVADSIKDYFSNGYNLEELEKLLAGGDRSNGGRTLPAKGLCLEKVEY